MDHETRIQSMEGGRDRVFSDRGQVTASYTNPRVPARVQTVSKEVTDRLIKEGVLRYVDQEEMPSYRREVGEGNQARQYIVTTEKPSNTTISNIIPM